MLKYSFERLFKLVAKLRCCFLCDNQKSDAILTPLLFGCVEKYRKFVFLRDARHAQIEKARRTLEQTVIVFSHEIYKHIDI